MTIEDLLELLGRLGACSKSLEWVKLQPDAREAWTACEDAMQLLWLVFQLGQGDYRDYRAAAHVYLRSTALVGADRVRGVVPYKEIEASAIARLEALRAG